MVKDDIFLMPNLFKIPYQEFNQLIWNKRIDSSYPFDIFINLDRILYITLQRRLLIPSETMNPIKDNVAYGLASSLMNVLLHYRNFFNYQDVDSRIIFYYTDSNSIKSLYESKIYNAFYDHIALLHPSLLLYRKQTIEIMTNVIPFIKNCHLIKSRDIESTVIPYLWEDGKRNKVIITNDPIEKQLCYSKNILPIIITLGRHRSYHIKIDDLEDDEKECYKKNFYFYLLSLLCNGSNQHNLDPIHKRICNPLKIINDGLSNHRITESITSMRSILGLIDDKELEDKLYDRYKLLSVDYKSKLVTDTEKLHWKSLCNNLYDPKGLEGVNRNYFNHTLRIDFI